MPAASLAARHMPKPRSRRLFATLALLVKVSVLGQCVATATLWVVVEWRVRLSSSARNQRRLASCPALNSDHFRHSQSL